MLPTSTVPPPTVKVARRGADRLKQGHVWVYRSDVVSADGIAPGSVVGVADERGKFLGTAFYSSASQIAIRMISRDHIDELDALLRRRIGDAIAYRERIVQNSDACRLVFSEADFLPGLIVDRYNDLLALQVLTQAMDAEPVREVVLSELSQRIQAAAIVERVEPKIRELEQLPARASGVLQGEKTSTVFSMNGVKFHYSAAEGQKTGAFLDQRENYAAAAQYAHGEALDVFCYQGSFALHLAQACSKVSGVDSSRPALEVADRNAALNGREIEWIEANAFDLLRDYASVAAVCAQERCDYPQYLLRLTERELIDRERRATERRIKEAQFPVIKTIDSFDFGAQPSINEPLVRELLRCEYIPKKENILLVGNPGTGKTHLATALGFAACSQGKRVRFMTTTALVTQLLEQRENRTLQRLYKQLQRQHLLILDELGYVPFTKAGAELLFDVVGRAYEQTSLIVTTNLPFEQWTEVLGSERLTGAMLDRLTHRVHILEANGQSYRLQDSKRRLRRK